MAREFNKKKPFKKSNGGKKKGPLSGGTDNKSFHEKTFGRSTKRDGFDPNKDLEHGEESYSVRKRKNLLEEDRKTPEEKKSYSKKSYGKPFEKSSSGDSKFKKRDEKGEGSKGFEKKSFGKKPFSKKPFGTASYKKSDERGGESSYRRRDEEPTERPTRFGKKPFDSSDDGNFKRRDDNRDERPTRFGKKPFDSSDDAGFEKRDDDREARPSRSDKKTFGKSARSTDKKPFGKLEGKPYDKPYGKISRNKDSDTEDTESPASEKKPYSGDKTSRDPKKPFKKFKKKPVSSGYKKLTKQDDSIADGLIRLNKYISNAGICSRREADELIRAGTVRVNGTIVTEMGYKVKPDDMINYGGETLRKEKLVYVLLNKPKDFITTLDDPGSRKTVFDLVKNACKERIYPVGRLDRNTTGVLLLTNDGDLTKKLTHPKHGIKKVYHVTLDKPLNKPDFDEIATNGVTLEDGHIKPDIISFVDDGNKKEVGLEIHSGRNRIVRRLFEQLGYTVVKLDRVVFAGLTKKDLPRGNYRILSEQEVGYLKMLGA